MFTPAWLTSLLDLTTVAEDAAIEARFDAGSPFEEVPNATADGDDLEAVRRESAHSAFSGTTAKTSFSQEEIAELDAEVMIDVLPSLAAAAEQMAKFLVPEHAQQRPVVWKEIRIEGSRHRKLFNNRVSSLTVHKRSFGSQEYIQPSVVLRALLGVQMMDDVPAGPWRPDDIIYAVNLAQMLHTTLTRIVDPAELDTEGYHTLVTLDAQFPTCIAGPEFDEEAVRMCLAIQTQLAVARLHAFNSHPDYDPMALINDTFFNRDVDGDMSYMFTDALGLRDLSQGESTAWTSTIKRVVDGLKAPFASQDEDLDAALATVRASYPWHDFVDQAVQYYLARKTRLDQRIAAVGGIDQIMLNASDEVERRNVARQIAEKRRSLGGTPKKSFDKGAISKAKALRKRLSEAAPASQAAPVASMMDPRLTQGQDTQPAQDDSWVRVEEDDYAEQPTAQQRAQSSLEQLSGFQDQQRQNAKKSKTRSYIDRQDHAQRVTFDDSQPSQQLMPGEGADFRIPGRSSAPGPYHVSPARNPAKRTYAEMDNGPPDFEPTQDEGFQTDVRDTAAADARRMTAPRPQKHRIHQPGSSSAGTVDYTYPGSEAAASQPPRKNPGSAIPGPTRHLEPEDDIIPREQVYQRAKLKAKQQRLTASQAKPPQVRKPWEQREELALIELIENHGGDGVSYAALKKQDDFEAVPALGRRSAEDIRFKARNMKLTFLL